MSTKNNNTSEDKPSRPKTTIKVPKMTTKDKSSDQAVKTKTKNDDVLNVGLEKENSTDDLSAPSLCSALQLASEIHNATEKIAQESNLRSAKLYSETIEPKAVKKTNIPFTKQIFKDLVNIQIYDEDIISGVKVSTKNNNFNKNKDSVFQLFDYYQPDFSTETCISIPNHKDEVEKVQYYNGSEIYNRISSLNVLWN